VAPARRPGSKPESSAQIDMAERAAAERVAEMTAAEQEAVLAALKAEGFVPSGGPGRGRRHRPAASRADVRMCHVLWGKLCRAGAVTVPGAAGLNSFIRARFEKSWGAVPIDIDTMRDWRQIAAVIEALKAMCLRAGVTP
jgi:hypothetical protein